MAGVADNDGDLLVITKQPKGEKSTKLRNLMDLDWDENLGLGGNIILVVQTSFRQLLKEIGLSQGGKSIALLKESIERLFCTSIMFEKDGKKLGLCTHSRLISFFLTDDKSESICIALNPLLSHQIFHGGEKGVKFAFVDMNEIRQLNGNNELMLHFHLCGWLDHGKSITVSIETLCSYIWSTPCSQNTLYFRKHQAKAALEKLKNLGWSVQEVRSDKFKITRPDLSSSLESQDY